MTTLEVAPVGYAAVPEHIHVLSGEAKHGTPSTVVQVLKQRVELPSEKCGARRKSAALRF